MASPKKEQIDNEQSIKLNRPPKAKKPRLTSSTSTSRKAIATSESNNIPLLHPPSLKGRPLPTLILDNGGWTIKHGMISPPSSSNPNTISKNESKFQSNQSTSTSTSTSTSIIKPNQSYNVIAKPKHVLTTLLSNEINTIQNKSNLIFKRPLER